MTQLQHASNKNTTIIHVNPNNDLGFIKLCNMMLQTGAPEGVDAPLHALCGYEENP